MSKTPDDLLYTEEHEYLRPAGTAGEYYVGITDYAQGELGDVVFVETPAVGDSFARMEVFGTVEAVKAVSDLYSPVSCEVIEVNPAIESDPSVVNADPYGDGWLIKVALTDESELDALLGAEEYRSHIGD
ncbi:MAG TPA: glycine cleavage system protein GcvH [Longimicrobiales bacterium]